MTVWKYFGQSNFKKANVMGLSFNGGRFEFDRMGEVKTRAYGNATCKSLLTYQQSFSLSIMHDWGYLSQDQVDFQRDVEKTVVPDQVTVTEVSVIGPKSYVDSNGKPVPN